MAAPIEMWWGPALGVLLGSLLWSADEPLAFVAAWACFQLWALVSASGLDPRRWAPWSVLTLAAGLLTWFWQDAPQVLGILGLILGIGAFPAHLWIEELRPRLPRHSHSLILVVQPGVALLHAYLVFHPHQLSTAVAEGLQLGFVLGALAQAGLGLVRSEPQRALGSILQSQALLVMAGVLAEEHGWEAARMLLISLVLSAGVLLLACGHLQERHGALLLRRSYGLAQTYPGIHRAFLVTGWLFVGLPGGIAFFAEDLLFHVLLHHSTLAVIGFVAAMGLNAIGFYRVYLGLFTGPAYRNRDGGFEPAQPESRDLVWLLCGASALILVGGFFPSLLT
jgi:NADH:ubiquinone oxidoreductase subunit 4 (subunit M)